MTELPLFARAAAYGSKEAVCDPEGTLGYDELLERSRLGALRLLELGAAQRRDLEEARIAFLVPSDRSYPIVQWSIWRAGGIAVPLCTSHPEPELEYVLRDSGASVVVVAPELESRVGSLAERLGVRWIGTGDLEARESSAGLPELTLDRRAMIVYTSGTTGGPKGVVTTHGNLIAQIESLVSAWEWVAQDSILLVLPLHHVHGIVNVLLCALWSGATCRMMRGFDASGVWRSFGASQGSRGALSLFMAVPTIYRKLIDAWEAAPEEEREEWSRGAGGLRLMVSGSAALPVTVLERWEEIAGQRLLERYGMSETGMILSNPLHGERRPGFVGVELPGIEVRLRDGAAAPEESDEEVLEGELEVRGPGVFREYFGKEEATLAAFGPDGWFRTGDRVRLERGSYRILGRTSVDIVKTGGYKVSALEIEEVLREHPAILECAVVGLPDDTWGERIAVAAVCEGPGPTLEGLRAWAKERLAPYKVPTLLKVVDELPRNVLGKVVKPQVKLLFRA